MKSTKKMHYDDGGWDPNIHADPSAGPCHIEDCNGHLVRKGIAHGADVYGCTQCDIRTTTARGGN